jgi:DNA polymerase elongation subunit (family B)
MSLPVSDKDIVFQALEFISKDYIEESEEDVLFENGRSRQQTIKKKFFMIQIFGLTESGKTVCASVKGFRPYFYIGIPPNKNTEKFKKSLNAYIRKGFPQHVQNQIFVDEKEFKVLYDFNNNEKIPVLEISMPSKDTFNKMKNKFLDENMNSKQLPLDVSKEAVTLKIYEANIDPMLRFFHTRDISPSGWIRITGSQENEEGTETADINISAEADEVFPETKLDSAPFKIISWDIECMSSHGDFPVPKKSYRKVAREIIESKWQNPEIEIFAELPEALVGNSTKHFSFISLKNKNVIPKKLLEPEQKAKILKILKSADMKNEKKTDDITAILDEMLPGIEGDRCIQIGMTMWINNKPVEKWIYTLGSCDPVQSEDDGVPIHTIPFDNQDDFGERAMFTQWFTKLGEINPDILIGYNVFGFDEKYVWDRLDELDLVDNTDRLPKLNQKLAGKISRLTTAKVGLKEQMLSSGAMGDNLFYILEMPGRLQIDLLPYIRRNFSLQSYSLDSVSSHFMAGELKGEMTLQEGSRQLIIPSKKSTKGLRVGRYVVILDAENDKLSKKLEIIALTDREITVQVSGQAELTEINENGRPQFWCMVKDDVSPQDIFRLQKGTSADRSIVAKYCLQDCDLVMDLFNKLDALRNAQAMADVCCVPTGYIYMRGQGIKIESLIFKECMKEGQLIEVLTSAAFGENLVEKDSDKDSDSDDEEDEDSYEGAIVLEPKTGIYLNDPIATLDFASLYPSTIISENLSHDTVIWVKDYDLEGTFMSCREGSDKYDNLPGYKYVNVEFDILKPDPMDKRKNPKKIKTGQRIARYVQYEDNKKGTIPKILQKLLAARKSTRKLIETEKDDFKKTLLDCQQNAYKITANSLYGQLGSKTFKIRRVVLAASTTAYGRKQLIYAKVVVETVYGGGNNNRCDAEYVYGDTDSVFINFRVKDPLTGKRILGKDALQPVKDLAIEAGKLCTSALKAPHDFEFDKMMWPFCLLSKKRYVGNKYEDDLNKPVMTSMGIVMKRRDNAPIVKVIYGGVIDRILQKHDVRGAFTFCQQMAKELVAGKFGMTKLTITKSLRAEYANPERIAHKVLADRIGARDPGNKPSSSERIGYIFVTTPKGKPEPKLQGERIETPAFIRANNLIPDYSYYIERQLAKPLAQVFALVLADLPGYKKEMIPSSITDEKKLVAKKQKIAEQLLFGEILGTWKNKQSGQMDIRSLFFPKK